MSTQARDELGSDAETEDGEDSVVDFSNASLYLSGIQTIFTIVCCATVSVMASSDLISGVSAVRTLALCTACGVLLMRKPLRVGRVHGIKVIFSALQPAVPLYLLALVVEQLVHTCTNETTTAPSWRRVVFHTMVLAMLVSGLMRARFPLEETDVPFLITAFALLVIALLPPPAVALLGPLCQSVDGWQAADRLVRALAFAVVYAVHVYATIAARSAGSCDTIVIVVRSASASMWTVGASAYWLPMAVVQCGVVIMARLSIERAIGKGSRSGYAKVPSSAPEPEQDVEAARTSAASTEAVSPARVAAVESSGSNPGRISPLASVVPIVTPPVDVQQILNEVHGQPQPPQPLQPLPQPPTPTPGVAPQPEEPPAVGPLKFRELTAASVVPDPQHPPEVNGTHHPKMTPERMAEIAASIPD